MPRVTIRYFAALRERAGVSKESLDTSASNLSDLYDELRQRHGFQLTARDVKAALNADWASMESVLHEGDEVVFIPPVAGG